MKRTWRAITFCVLAMLWATPAAFAGWMIEEKSADENTMLYFQDDMMRHESSGSVSIMDLKKGVLYIVNPAKKTYWVGPVAALQKLQTSAKGQMEAAMAQMKVQMEQQMAHLPPAQRQAIMDAMGKQMQGKQGGVEGERRQLRVDIKRMGETATIAGHKARKREVWVNGKLREELWIATSVNISKEIDVEKMSKLMNTLGGLNSETAYEFSPKVMALWKEGYPLRQVDHGDSERQVTEAVQAVRKAIPASLFQAPAGYRKVEMMEAMQE